MSATYSVATLADCMWFAALLDWLSLVLQIPNPELGPLEQRVSATYEDATLSDDINVEDTKYWFNPPQGVDLTHAHLIYWDGRL